MIHSFSHRTDGPAFYWDWFLARLDAGFVQVRNPYYPDKVSTYDITPEGCDGFTFTSKDYRPVIDGAAKRLRLSRLVEEYPTMWAFTITPYLSDVEPRVPSNADAIACAKVLSGFVGRERLRWMYSPIAMSDTYTLGYHMDAFAYLARELAPWVSSCSLDVLRVYEKVARNAPGLREPHKYELDALLQWFGSVAAEEGLHLHACPAHHDWSEFGVDMSPCMSLARFGEANGIAMKEPKGRKGEGLYGTCPAGCAPVKDLASYDTCPAGCTYCYANARPHAEAGRADVSSPMLLDSPRMHDSVSFAKQRMYRA